MAPVSIQGFFDGEEVRLLAPAPATAPCHVVVVFTDMTDSDNHDNQRLGAFWASFGAWQADHGESADDLVASVRASRRSRPEPPRL